jgi:hypothetical protein
MAERKIAGGAGDTRMHATFSKCPLPARFESDNSFNGENNMTETFDPFAPIQPNKSLGGLQLRSHISTLSKLLVGLGITQRGDYKLISPFEARYFFGDGSIQCAIDVRNGRVFKLIATGLYKGNFADKIHVGMAVKEAFVVEPSLFYNEAEEHIFCRGVEGIVFDVPVIDPYPSDVPSLVISSIAVYAAEAFTADGQEGNW